MLDEFLSKFHPPGKLLFAKIWGSKSHNTNKEDSDTDYSGVYLCPTSQFVSLNSTPENFQHNSEDNKSNIPDYAFYELNCFCKLLLKGNPGILEMLWTERLCIMTPEWESLRSIRHKFLSKQAVQQYLGYMNGQLNRLTKGQSLHTAGSSYSEKLCYHLLRLSEDAKRIAVGGSPVVWKEGEERDFLMKIRYGEYSWLEVQQFIQDAISSIEALKPWNIPEQGDKEALNDWLVKLRKENW